MEEHVHGEDRTLVILLFDSDECYCYDCEEVTRRVGRAFALQGLFISSTTPYRLPDNQSCSKCIEKYLATKGIHQCPLRRNANPKGLVYCGVQR
jgi:hypothetical protein